MAESSTPTLYAMPRDGEEGDNTTMLHVPDGYLGDMGVEVQDFITRRIRELNGVDASDPRPICMACVVVTLQNAVFSVVFDAADTGEPLLIAGGEQLLTSAAVNIAGEAKRLGFAGFLATVRKMIGR